MRLRTITGAREVTRAIVACAALVSLPALHAAAQGFLCLDPVWFNPQKVESITSASPKNKNEVTVQYGSPYLIGKITLSGSGGGHDAYGNLVSVSESIVLEPHFHTFGPFQWQQDLAGHSSVSVNVRVVGRDGFVSVISADGDLGSFSSNTLTVDILSCSYTMQMNNHIAGTETRTVNGHRIISHHDFVWGPSKDAAGRSASGVAIQFYEDPALRNTRKYGRKLSGKLAFVAPEPNTENYGVKLDWNLEWILEPETEITLYKYLH